MATCRKCGKYVSNTEPVRIEGIAGVAGYTSLERFVDEGVEWTEISDIEDETWRCPYCHEFNDVFC